jgi:mono/diheme cytochrome c family protein
MLALHHHTPWQRFGGKGLALSLLAVALAGCGSTEPPRFRLNLEGRDRSQISLEKQRGLVDALVAAYGEPDDPYILPEFSSASLGPDEFGLDLKKVQLAAGPSWSDQSGVRHGLYRKHCAHCHGVSGDGLGPTARFLNPYPRDYRQGTFKFTSTGATSKPTRDDLKRTIEQGIPGTAMPAFSLLPADEVDALVEYVIYLSMRGETELYLYEQIVNQDALLPLARDVILSEAQVAFEGWKTAADGVVVPPPRTQPVDTPEQLAASIEAGSKLFQDQVRVQCAKCHGTAALGDVAPPNILALQEGDFDIWNRPKVTAMKGGASLEEVEQLWSLPLQYVAPRNLRLGIYRGGRRPMDLYRRIHAGIKGAAMPALGATPSNPSGLKPEEIWQLVDYVRSLPYEPIDSLPPPTSSHADSQHTAE